MLIKVGQILSSCFYQTLQQQHITYAQLQPLKLVALTMLTKYKNPAVLNIIESYFLYQTEVHI